MNLKTRKIIYTILFILFLGLALGQNFMMGGGGVPDFSNIHDVEMYGIYLPLITVPLIIIGIILIVFSFKDLESFKTKYMKYLTYISFGVYIVIEIVSIIMHLIVGFNGLMVDIAIAISFIIILTLLIRVILLNKKEVKEN